MTIHASERKVFLSRLLSKALTYLKLRDRFKLDIDLGGLAYGI